MKRYQKIQETHKKLDDMERTISLALDDAWEYERQVNHKEARQQWQAYQDSLREQAQEIAIRKREAMQPELKIAGELVAWYEANELYLNSNILDADEQSEFAGWIMFMNEEVE